MLTYKKNYIVESSFRYNINGEVIWHDFTGSGAHRIRGALGRPGQWEPYTGIARYKKYYATTEYYKDVLPTIFSVVEGEMT